MNELDAVEGFQEEGVKEYYKQSAFLIEKMNGFKTKIEIHSPYHANLKSILSLKEAADQQMDTYLKHELKRQGATQDLISTQLEEMNQCLSANLHLDAFNGHLEQFCRLRNQLNDCRKTIEFIAKLNPAVAEESVQSLASATAEFEKTARKLEQRANHVIDSMRMRFTPRAMGELKT